MSKKNKENLNLLNNSNEQLKTEIETLVSSLENVIERQVTEHIRGIIAKATERVMFEIEEEVDEHIKILKRQTQQLETQTIEFQKQKKDFFTSYGLREVLFWIGTIMSILTPIVLVVIFWFVL